MIDTEALQLKVMDAIIRRRVNEAHGEFVGEDIAMDQSSFRSECGLQ